MNSFANAARKTNIVTTHTTNGMPALKNTGSACLDFFGRGASLRGSEAKAVELFQRAYKEDKELALRILQYIRDIRGGQGQRETFRQCLTWLSSVSPEDGGRVLRKIPEIGRWDDVFSVTKTNINEMLTMVRSALIAGDRLCAKWMPRQGPIAVALRQAFRMTPKQWRKTLVGLTDVVETQMCQKRWNQIDFNKVPSLAAVRYRKAFTRNSVAYTKYTEALTRGDEGVKINASAVFPYDVLKGVARKVANGYHWGRGSEDYVNRFNSQERAVVNAQWEALPDYMDDSSVLAMLDSSGSMLSSATGVGDLSCMDVAMSLSLYTATKTKGPFKDLVLNFAQDSKFIDLRSKAEIFDKAGTLVNAAWDGSTNLESALMLILNTARRNQVLSEDMPKLLVIYSDMQFNGCLQGLNALDMIRQQYRKCGYEMPVVVFWNLNGTFNNVPVSIHDSGVALVSGFSPATMKAILSCQLDTFTPEGIMRAAVCISRYDC